MRHLISLLLITCSSFANAACTLQAFSGKASDLKNQKLLYQEDYQRVWQDDKLIRDQVEYRDANHQLFAIKRVLYKSGLSHPSFKLIDQRAHYIEAAELNNQQTQIWYQVPGKTKITQSQLALPENAVHDAGFNELVQKNWQTLQQGKTIPMQFLAPSRASYLNFLITPAKQQKPKTFQVTLSATNAVFKWAIEPINLTYDATSKQLLQFSGLTNIKNPEGKNYRAQIDYIYQPKNTGDCPNNLTEDLESFKFAM